MSDKETPREWLKPSQLAAREGVSKRTLWTWAEKGIVDVKRRAPRTGVKMRFVDDEDD